MNKISVSSFQDNPEISAFCKYADVGENPSACFYPEFRKSDESGFLKLNERKIISTSLDLFRSRQDEKNFENSDSLSHFFSVEEFFANSKKQNKKSEVVLNSFSSENDSVKSRIIDSQISQDKNFALLIGGCEKIKKVKRDIFQVKDKSCKVLFFGESGTGKSCAAHILHRSGNLSKNKFVSVNVGALQKDLIETSLFGSVKGAYTDATNRQGLINLAENGTLFLDEIGELPLSCQPQLLRALDEGIYRKVGSDAEEKMNVRFVFATNANLKELVKQKLFREDLYWRIAEFVIEIPPLRERREDILLIAEHFLNELVLKYSSEKKYFSESAKEKLLMYDWPGNIRELRTCINIAMIYSASSKIDASDIRFI